MRHCSSCSVHFCLHTSALVALLQLPVCTARHASTCHAGPCQAQGQLHMAASRLKKWLLRAGSAQPYQPAHGQQGPVPAPIPLSQGPFLWQTCSVKQRRLTCNLWRTGSGQPYQPAPGQQGPVPAQIPLSQGPFLSPPAFAYLPVSLVSFCLQPEDKQQHSCVLCTRPDCELLRSALRQEHPTQAEIPLSRGPFLSPPAFAYLPVSLSSSYFESSSSAECSAHDFGASSQAGASNSQAKTPLLQAPCCRCQQSLTRQSAWCPGKHV